MQIVGVSLKGVFDTTQQMEIPFFQRSYVWNEENWLRLWESIKTIVEKKQNPYLGSVILKKKESSNQEHPISRSQIIDGQQRLTTLSIVFRAIFDSIPEAQDEKNRTKYDWKTQLIDMLFYCDKNNKMSYETRIRHSYKDREDYNFVIGLVEKNAQGDFSIKRKDGFDECLDEIKEDPSLYEKRKILACYLFFKNKIDSVNPGERWDYFDKLYECENLLVRILLDEKDRNEQDIFDTINSAGQRLTSYDLIKNNLFSRFMELSGSEKDVMSFYDEKWGKTFDEDDEFWATDRGHGNYTSRNADIIVQAYAMNKGIFNPNDGQTRSELSNLYRKYVQEKCTSVESIKALIEELCSYAKVYKERLKPIGSQNALSYEDWEKRLLNMLERISENVFVPYVLHLYMTYATDENKLKEKFHELEVFVMRNVISSKYSAKNFNRDVPSFIKDESKVVSMSNEISNTEIENCLKNSVSNSSATLILFWLELYRAFNNQDSKSDYVKTELRYEYTLEHVMPQKWHECWEDVLCYDYSNTNIDNKERDDKSKSKIYSIGNMTLVKQGFNSSLSNRPFKQKVNGWTDAKGKKRKGYKELSKLSITTDDILKKQGENGGFVDRDSWDERDIYSREEKLISEVLTLWGNPQA